METLRRLLVLLAYTLGGGIVLVCVIAAVVSPFDGEDLLISLYALLSATFFSGLTWAIVKAINWIFQHGEEKDAKRVDVTIKDDRG